MITETLKSNFFEKVHKGSGDDCWTWTGARLKRGYGLIKIPGTRRNILAHRLSYQMANGALSDNMLVCHRCDNPRCVNPNHLFLGSHQDNVQDMISKGRRVIVAHAGESNGNATLTADVVSRIKSIAKSYATIANDFGISKSQVARIKTGAAWANVQPA